MAVAAAPCEERDGHVRTDGRPIGEHGGDMWPALSVLSLLLRDGGFGFLPADGLVRRPV
jgi:hypothetical protein